MVANYTYIVCDPRSSRNHSCGVFTFPGVPFYVGKGRGNRCYEHRQKNNDVQQRVNEIRNFGFEPKVLVFETDTSEEALINERYFISVIGRKDKNVGPLLNRTNGGQGGRGGWDHINKKPNYKNSMQGKHHKEETKLKLSEKRKKFYANGGINPMLGTISPAKGKKWYNDGIKETMFFSFEVPINFRVGRLPK